MAYYYILPMHTRAKYQGKILFVSAFIVALIFTNLAFAYTVYETELPGIGLFKISKEYHDSYLFFILKMPVFVFVQRYYWYFKDAYGSETQPSWMTVSYDSDTNTTSIGIATLTREGSPLGSVPTYSFALYGEHAGNFIIFPEELASFDPEDTSEWKQEELLPEFVIPETPLGTITALTSMVFAFILYRKLIH